MNVMNYEEMTKKNLSENEYIIGIDLGTTHSVISYWNGQKNTPDPIDMSNGFGKIPMPSVVQLRKEDLDEEWIIGEEAYNSYIVYPESTVLSVKTKMGSDQKISLHHKEYLPEEISAKILKALLKQINSINPKGECIGVVVSVPYDFDDAAKKSTIRACQLAGIGERLISLIEEPKAAALAYNYQHPFKKNEKIMVFDFGGGTLDITLFQVAHVSDNEQTLKVLSEGGEAKHGGDVLDHLLYDHFMTMVREKGIEPSELTKECCADIMVKAKETKERLSGAEKVRIPFSSLMPPFIVPFKREEFEGISASFIEKTRNLIYRTLQDAYQGIIKPEEIDRVLLEGGSSQMPWVKKLMIEIFKDQSKIYSSEKPALDISLGACIYAAMKLGVHQQKDLVTGSQIMNFEVCVPHDIGFEVDMNNRKTFFTMIARGTPYRLAKRSQIFTVSGNSDEDMTQLSVKILERMHKEQGIEGCSLIGKVDVVGLPKRPKGETQLKVELSIEEESGIVTGSVEDIGYRDIHKPSGFVKQFIPDRHATVELSNER